MGLGRVETHLRESCVESLATDCHLNLVVRLPVPTTWSNLRKTFYPSASGPRFHISQGQKPTLVKAPHASIGVDIGKEVFHLVGYGTNGKITFRRKIKRLALVDTFKKLPQCIVGMEACLSAHFISRAICQLGHEPRIIPAIYVKPFVKGQKNDYNDAEAIAEAMFVRQTFRPARSKPSSPSDAHRTLQDFRPDALMLRNFPVSLKVSNVARM